MHPFLPALDVMTNSSQKEFEAIQLLPIKDRFNQCINSIVSKYFYKQCLHYLNGDFVKPSESDLSLRNSYQKLKQPFRKTSIGQSTLSFFGPSLWNKIPEEIKRTSSINKFTNKLQKYYLNEIGTPSF